MQKQLQQLERLIWLSWEAILAIPHTEFDEQGNIVGWGVTLVPTAHHIQLHGRPLYTWCAFDTVLFPALLQTEAQVQSVCAATGRPIAFLVTRQGIQNSLRQRACCHSSCPRSDVTVFEEPFVSSRSFSTQQRRPHLGRRCTPTPCSSRWKKRLLSDKPSRKWDHSNPFYEEWRTNLML